MIQYRFVHHAMACEWELRLDCDDADEAEYAARASFDEIDRLELELSRFIESSDIARLSDLSNGDSRILGSEAFDCLQRAQELFALTDGAFDVSLGGGLDALQLDPATRTVTQTKNAKLSIDLGGIGKGYTIDAVVEQLAEWDIDAALITSGQSTVRALGSARTISVRDPRDHDDVLARMTLCDRTFSGSGTLLHGQHIVDPRTQRAATGPIGAWALADNSADSDALSTTFMIVDPHRIPAICSAVRGAAALWLTDDGTLHTHGDIPWAVDA